MYLKTAELLESHGHSVVFFSMQHPRNLPCETDEFFMPYLELTTEHGILNKIRIAGRILYSFKARKNLSDLLDKYHVDVAHLHDIGYHISPSILHVLKKRNIPIVMTLHNLRMVCASYHMFAGGEVCEACCNGKYYKATVKMCVKDSFAKSLLAVLEMYLHHKILNIYDNVDVFIAPGLFLKKKLQESGFKKRMLHLPNFFTFYDKEGYGKEDNTNDNKKTSIAYVGRLSHEKGLITLLDAAKLLQRRGSKILVNVVGDGQMMNELRDKVAVERISNVRFLGYLKHENVYREIKNNLAVVLPSECYENNPLSVLEAFALGKPVIGSRRGGIPELVKDHERGVTFEPGNPEDLAAKIEFLVNNPDKAELMGKKARDHVEKELNAEKHYQGLMEIYEQAAEGFTARS